MYFRGFEDFGMPQPGEKHLSEDAETDEAG
jgi:hypothetical protein